MTARSPRLVPALVLLLPACGDTREPHGDKLAASPPISIPTATAFTLMSDDSDLTGWNKFAGTIVDSDGDRLTDLDEKIRYKTDPRNPDTDHDGLQDGWEIHGVNGIDLAELGASPLHRDVFVEMDYMTRESATHGLGPGDDVLKRIVEIFANAPVDNPDGLPGIRLHLELGNQVAYDENLQPLNKEFYALRRDNFQSDVRGPVYHYMIWANAYDNGDSSGYSMNIPGSDFVVTLGRWHKNTGGTDDEKVGTFIHELGHNLGLRHGSIDDTNRKPNHLSVMNYNFQTSGVSVKGGHVWGFQTFEMSALDENALLESDGLQPRSATIADYETMWRVLSGASRRGTAGGPLDWTGNKKIDTGKVQVDLNGDGKNTLLDKTINEWIALKYLIGTIGSREKRFKLRELAEKNFVVQPVEELTEAQDQIIKASLAPP